MSKIQVISNSLPIILTFGALKLSIQLIQEGFL